MSLCLQIDPRECFTPGASISELNLDGQGRVPGEPGIGLPDEGDLGASGEKPRLGLHRGEPRVARASGEAERRGFADEEPQLNITQQRVDRVPVEERDPMAAAPRDGERRPTALDSGRLRQRRFDVTVDEGQARGTRDVEVPAIGDFQVSGEVGFHSVGGRAAGGREDESSGTERPVAMDGLGVVHRCGRRVRVVDERRRGGGSGNPIGHPDEPGANGLCRADAALELQAARAVHDSDLPRAHRDRRSRPAFESGTGGGRGGGESDGEGHEHKAHGDRRNSGQGARVHAAPSVWLALMPVEKRKKKTVFLYFFH